MFGALILKLLAKSSSPLLCRLYFVSVISQDPLPLALIYILSASPLAGYLTDKHGAEWVTILSILLALPWWFLIIIEYRLAFFIAAFGIECKLIFDSPPLGFHLLYVFQHFLLQE